MSRNVTRRTRFSSRVFWPEHCTHLSSGFIIGWNLRSLIASVVTVIPDIQLSVLIQALNNLAECPSLSELWDICGGHPVLLGEWWADTSKPVRDSDSNRQIIESRLAADFWITLLRCKCGLPEMHDLYCCGYRYHTSSQFVLYETPTALTPFAQDIKHSHNFLNTNFNSNYTDLDFTIRQANAGFFIEKKLLHLIQNPLFLNPNPLNKLKMNMNMNMESISITEKEKECTSNIQNIPILETEINNIQNFQNYNLQKEKQKSSQKSSLYHIISLLCRIITLLKYIFIIIMNINNNLNFIINNIRVFTNKYILIDEEKEKEKEINYSYSCFLSRSSCFLDQWLWLCKLFNDSHNNNECKINNIDNFNFKNSNTMNTSFSYNFTIFLLRQGLDILFGRLFYIYILFLPITNDVFSFIHNAFTRERLLFYVDLVQNSGGVIVGMKLNAPLLQAFNSLTLQLSTLASLNYLLPLSLLFNTLSYLLLFGGLSWGISFIYDILNFMAFHIFILDSIFTKIYRLSLILLLAMFRLFRGMKKNILRHRLDYARYTLDQLLLGTLLFTSLCFLYPTIFIYHLAFSCARLLYILIQFPLLFILYNYDAFPLSTLGLYFFDRRRLADGIKFRIMSPLLYKEYKNKFKNNIKINNTKSNSNTCDIHSDFKSQSPLSQSDTIVSDDITSQYINGRESPKRLIQTKFFLKNTSIYLKLQSCNIHFLMIFNSYLTNLIRITSRYSPGMWTRIIFRGHQFTYSDCYSYVRN